MAASRTKFNEGKALDAVLRRIEERDAVSRGNDLRSPEKEDHAAPIELVCTIGNQFFAFEHTGIEPFPRQIEMGERSQQLFRPIEDQLVGRLPPEDSFELHVPVDAALGIKRPQLKAVQDALTNWICMTAHTLPIAPYGRYILPINKVMLPGVPFPIVLHRLAAIGPMRGRFSMRYLVSADLESARVKRLRESCEKKFGKLAEWKRQHGARTVLVLEDADIQLTNEQLVAEALALAEQGRADRPDEIYVVNSCVETAWWVTCIRREGKTYYDDGERFWQVDPASLVRLTDR